MATLIELLKNKKVFNGEYILYRDQLPEPIELKHDVDAKCFIRLDTLNPQRYLLDTDTLRYDDWQIKYPPRLITKSDLETACTKAWISCYKNDLPPQEFLILVILKELGFE